MKFIKLFFIFLMPLFVFSQTKKINVELKFHDGYGPFKRLINWPVKWDDTSIAVKDTYPDVKGIPSGFKNIKRGIIWFDAQQYIYQNYIEGKISNENFSKIKNNSQNEFNEKLVVNSKIKCFVNLVSATNEKNKNIYLIDANNNYDFSDDNPLIPSDQNIPDKELNKHLIKVRCQRILNHKIINDSVSLLIVKRGSYLLYSIAQYATATLNIEHQRYQLAVCPSYFYSRSWKQTQIVLMTDSLKTKKAGRNLICNNGEFISIGHNIYKFNGVDITKNLMTLQKMSSNNQYSSQVGFHAPLFKGINLLTEKDISLVSYRGKYILIDFWGTWCHPCRQQLPDLIKVNNSADSSRFVLISVASLDSIDNIKKVIVKEKMTWPQIFSDKITSNYHVSAFPSNLLINPSGVVIAKDLSMDDLKQKLSELALLGN